DGTKKPLPAAAGVAIPADGDYLAAEITSASRHRQAVTVYLRRRGPEWTVSESIGHCSQNAYPPARLPVDSRAPIPRVPSRFSHAGRKAEVAPGANALGLCGCAGRRRSGCAGIDGERLPPAGRVLFAEDGKGTPGADRRRRVGEGVLRGGTGGVGHDPRASLRSCWHEGGTAQTGYRTDSLLRVPSSRLSIHPGFRASVVRGVLLF